MTSKKWKKRHPLSGCNLVFEGLNSLLAMPPKKMGMANRQENEFVEF
jgi:hypothetical protein